MADVLALTITRLGAQGDGICETEQGPIFVPFALPGENVRVEMDGARGRLVEVVSASPDRIAPLCRHFTICGGCSTQHLAAQAYLNWKSEQVRIAFAQRGLEIQPQPVIVIGPGQRRRATFAALRTNRGIVLGFHEAASREIVDLACCPVLVPEIENALPALRNLIEPLLSRRGEARVSVTAVESGLDVAVEETSKELDAGLRAALATAAANLRILRLNVGGEQVYAGASPELRFGDVAVVPPPAAFLQASRAAEIRIAEIIMAALPKRLKRVADLFCGVGTFTFPLAARAEVLAIDGEATAIEALKRAVRHATKLKPIEARVRDLFREPLSRKELEGIDAVVLDPPRAGAKAQVEMLGRSKVGTVVAVSCAPATLARDARILVDAGYKLESVTPIDQFVFSAHVEAVAVFRR